MTIKKSNTNKKRTLRSPSLYIYTRKPALPPSLSKRFNPSEPRPTRISLDEIQPGDLLFYNHGSSIGHVAIYIGGGQIIHASTERTGIIIGNAFYTTPACATRIID